VKEVADKVAQSVCLPLDDAEEFVVLVAELKIRAQDLHGAGDRCERIPDLVGDRS
jgi:hypothetical protein